MQAAKKIFCRIYSGSDDCTYVFSIQEVTKNSENTGTIYQYRGVRSKVDKPTIIKIGETEHVIKYENMVCAYRGEEESNNLSDDSELSN